MEPANEKNKKFSISYKNAVIFLLKPLANTGSFKGTKVRGS